MRLAIRHIPFTILLLPLIGGICGAYFASLWLFLLGIILLTLTSLFFLWRKHALSIQKGCIYALISLFIGSFAFFQTRRALDSTQLFLPTQTTYYQIQLTDFPATKEKTVLCDAQLQHVQYRTHWHPIHGHIKLYIAKDSLSLALQQGDILLVETQLRQPTAKNPDDFDYMHYLRLTGYSATGYVQANHWTTVSHEPQRGIRARAIQCRNALYNRYQQAGLHDEELAIVSALTLGYTEDMDASTRQSFTIAGAAHILAVSGLHTAVIYGVLWSFFTLFGFAPILYKHRLRRQITTWIIICLLWFYAFIAGLTPSILRSVLMLSILSLGQCMYYRTNTYNILAAAAFIELIIYPLHIFTASFLLSYSAVLSIVYLYPRFMRFYRPKHRITQWIYDLLIVSIVAQVGTLPWTLYFFGQTSNYFAITNLTVLPLSYLIMALAILLLIVLPIPYVGTGCAWLLEKITHGTLWVVQTIESLPGATTHLQLTTPMVALFIVFIVSFCIYAHTQRRPYIYLSITCILLFIGCYTYRLSQEAKQEQLIAYSSYPHTTILHQHGRTCTILTNDSAAALRTTANYRRYHYLQTPVIQPLDSVCSFSYHNQNFLIINGSALENKTLTSPIHTDVLLLGNIGRISIPRLLRIVEADTIIALSTLSKYKSGQLQTLLPTDTIPFYDLHTSAHIWR